MLPVGDLVRRREYFFSERLPLCNCPGSFASTTTTRRGDDRVRHIIVASIVEPTASGSIFSEKRSIEKYYWQPAMLVSANGYIASVYRFLVSPMKYLAR